MFIAFLQSRTPFSNTFANKHGLAEEFYSSIRCGVLHEAGTKIPWTIWAKGPKDAIIDEKEKILYRNNFEEALKKYIQWYEHELLSDPHLQSAFIRKFDHLCQ